MSQAKPFGPEPVTVEIRSDAKKRTRVVVRRTGDAAFDKAMDPVQRDAYDDLCDARAYAMANVRIAQSRYDGMPGHRGPGGSENPRMIALHGHYLKWMDFMVDNAPADVFTAILNKLDHHSPERIGFILNPHSKRPNYRRAIRLILLGLDAYAYTRGWTRNRPKFK
jgi:hypothetical protein